MRHKNILTTALLLIVAQAVEAQYVFPDFLRSTGKIMSVVVGIVIIFLGIVYYLWKLDKKITKLENQLNDEQ